MRGFLGIAVLYVTTSAFTPAKCVRDKQESLTVVNRVEQARLEKLPAEHDPFRNADAIEGPRFVTRWRGGPGGGRARPRASRRPCHRPHARPGSP
ncbi:YiaA/YiaB family inner membrane protein [Pseudonocardia sp. T1-2H]|uniref:YiaA/YiaB family inner membrane protein n=1 Tax=Pseudonocardia sp. T1-2H TaxID=3128899 RepID=UPI0040549E72